jgi:hypothetical protein
VKKRGGQASRRDFTGRAALSKRPADENDSARVSVRTVRSISNALIFNTLFHNKRFH